MGFLASDSQSAIEAEDRPVFSGIPYLTYDPALRFEVEAEPVSQTAVPSRSDPNRQRRRIRHPDPYHVLDRGIGHINFKPATPRLNGKVERSHRIDAEEFYRMLDAVVIAHTELFN
jgi:hypothetical protein